MVGPEVLARSEHSTEGLTEATESAPILVVRNLRAYFQTRHFGIEREVRAVDDISLHVRKNEIYGLAGESSSGKTTLIKTIAGAIHPPLTVVGGSVEFKFPNRTINIYQATPTAIADMRWENLSYIMQGSMNVLNPVRRIRKTFVDFAFRHIKKPMPEFLQVVEDHLQRLKLQPSILNAYPHELSGGMRQRVTIALATVCRPDFIIADEPTTALDVVVQKEVLSMIREVQQQIGSSMLFVTHDLAVHANLTDRLGIMYAGRLVEEGNTKDIFTTPKHPYTVHLIGALPRIGDSEPRKGLEGAPPNLADPPAGCRFHPRCPLAMDVCTHTVPNFQSVGSSHRVACHAVAKEHAVHEEAR